MKLNIGNLAASPPPKKVRSILYEPQIAGPSHASNKNQRPTGVVKEMPNKTKQMPAAFYIFSGSIAQIINERGTISKNSSHNVLFECYGEILSITPGRFECEKIILLQAENGVLEGVFHEIDLSLSPVCRNQLVRCVGKFTSQGRFQIIKLGPTTHNQGFIDSINRLNSFSSFAIMRT